MSAIPNSRFPLPYRSCGSILFILLCGFSQLASAQPEAFITKWQTASPGSFNNTSVAIPIAGDGYNYEVDWNNDGVYDETGITGAATHDFGAPGEYVIRIRGSFPRIFFSNGGDATKLRDIIQWGSIAWTSMENAFYGCKYLDISATDVPDLSKATSMARMFAECAALKGPANMGDWNTSTVTDMAYLFAYADNFDGPIGSWNTAAVTTMSSMFAFARSFNQPIGDWNTAAVTNMYGMFAYTSFFNQPIGNWNTAAVTDMGAMFYEAGYFNQPVITWNTAGVQNMAGMFFNARAFNQSLGTWTLNPSVNLANMLGGQRFNMDCANYSATLTEWANNPAAPANRSLGALNLNYGTDAAPARDMLIAAKGWKIEGDAMVNQSCISVNVVEPYTARQLTIQPHPFSGSAIIRLTSERTVKGRLRIADAAGRVFMEETLTTSPAATEWVWNASALPPGIYFVRFESESGAVTRRAVRM